MAGFEFALLAAAGLIGAALLAVLRNARTPEQLKSEQRSVLLAALLNIIPGLGLWLIVKRPMAALTNLATAILVVTLVLWVESKHFHSWWFQDTFAWILWLEVGSIAWAYHSAMRKAGLTEQSVLKAGRSK